MKKETIMECPPLFPRDKMDLLIDLWAVSWIVVIVGLYTLQILNTCLIAK